MKRLYLIILFLFSVAVVFAQPLPATPGTAPRSNSSVIPEDYNLSVRSVFLYPRFNDTAQANTYTKPGFDTLARHIFTYDVMGDWVRVSNGAGGKKWQQISGVGINNEIHVFTLGGQSNAVGNSGFPDSAIVPIPGTAFQFYNNAITPAVEPIGTSNGSAWGAFASTYYKLTGAKICFVPTAVNGSSMASAANIGFGTWDTTGTLYATSVTLTNNALTALAAAGYTPVFKGVLWAQGETDADGINRGLITQNVYSAAFAKLIKNYRQQFGKNIAFNISRTGFRTDTIQTGFLQVQAAQVSISNGDSLTNITYWNAPFFIQRSLMVDNYHYDQTGYNEMGRVMAEEYINSMARNWQPQLNNVYIKQGNVGIGDIIPTSPLHIYKTGTASELRIEDSLNDAVRIDLVNKLNGAFSGSGIRLHNSGGLRSHIVQLSAGSSLESNALWMFNTIGNVLLGSDVGFTNIYAGGTATPNNAILRVSPNRNIGMGINVTPAASTLVDMQSTTMGLRMPTMTTAQQNAISSPVNGLIIYNTDSSKHCYYNGSAWTCYESGGGGASVNIYNSDGTVDAERSVDGGTNNIIWQNFAEYVINGDDIIFEVMELSGEVSTRLQLDSTIGVGLFPYKGRMKIDTLESTDVLDDMTVVVLDTVTGLVKRAVTSLFTTNIYNSDGTITDATRTVDLDGNQLVFFNSGLGTGVLFDINNSPFEATASTITLGGGTSINMIAGDGVEDYFDFDINTTTSTYYGIDVTSQQLAGWEVATNVIPITRILASQTGSFDNRIDVTDSIKMVHDDVSASTTGYRFMLRNTFSGSMVDFTGDVIQSGGITTTQVAFGSGDDFIKGENDFVYDETNNVLTIPNITQTSAVTTGTINSITANSLTSGTGISISSSSLTGGNLVSITGTSTELAAGNEGLNIALSGANASSSITATGARISVTNTGTGSTNIGLAVTASGAGTNTAIAATGNITTTATLTADGNVRLNGSASGFIVNNRANPTAAVMTIYGSDANGINFFASADVYRFKTDGELLVNTTADNGAFNLQVNGSARIAGNITLPTAGNKLNITTGSNASVGQATLVGGTVTVNTTAVTASSLIFFTVATPGGTQGNLSVGTITAGTSFVINSTSGTETSVVNYWLVN